MLVLRCSDGTRLVPSKNRQTNVFRTDFLIFPYNLYSHHLVTVMQALTSTSRVLYKKSLVFYTAPEKKSVEKMLFLQFPNGTLLVPSKNRQTNVFRMDFLKNPSYFTGFPKKIHRKNDVFAVFGWNPSGPIQISSN